MGFCQRDPVICELGARAASDLIGMHPGQWEIAASGHTPSALAFWLRFVSPR